MPLAMIESGAHFSHQRTRVVEQTLRFLAQGGKTRDIIYLGRRDIHVPIISTATP